MNTHIHLNADMVGVLDSGLSYDGALMPDALFNCNSVFCVFVWFCKHFNFCHLAVYEIKIVF